jgi:hypothetical protein
MAPHEKRQEIPNVSPAAFILFRICAFGSGDKSCDNKIEAASHAFEPDDTPRDGADFCGCPGALPEDLGLDAGSDCPDGAEGCDELAPGRWIPAESIKYPSL